MADECEADDAYGLKHTRPDDSEAFVRVAFQFRSDVRAFYQNRGDDDDHADEGEPGCT